MPLISLIPIGNAETCSVNIDGTITLAQRVIERLQWQPNQKIAISYSLEPLAIVLRAAKAHEPGFTLSS